jgi:alkylhydroperoxidase/carboxymuconolactone decarboxylase family protein YurZ
MPMLDWNSYCKQLVAGVGEIAKISPDTVRGYTTIGGAGVNTDHLGAKTRELVALAVAITLRCQQEHHCPGRVSAAGYHLGGCRSTRGSRSTTK